MGKGGTGFLRVVGLLLLLSEAVLLGVTPVRAADDTLEEIVVTARYRTENLQQTPIAITSLSGADLEARGLTNILEVSQSAPNVTLLSGQGSGSGGGKSAVAFIRGVGQADFNPAFEPGVGFYLDDVYQGTLFGSIFTLGDIDRVDVLRGPQGTLFGKNNEGGAVRLYSTTPKGDDSGYVEAAYGNFNDERLRGAWDVSVIPDQLFMRISGGSEHRDGYIQVEDFACSFPSLAGSIKPTRAGNCQTGTEGGLDVRSFRAALRYVPSSQLEVNLSADLTDDTSQAAAQQLIGLNLAPGSGLSNYNQYVAIPTYGIPLDSRFIPSDAKTTYANFCETSTGRCVTPQNTVFAWGISNSVIWLPNDDLRVKNILGYRRDSGRYSSDDSASPIPVELGDNHLEHHQFTEEINVGGSVLNKSFEWTAGLYYYSGFFRYGQTELLSGLQIVPPGVLPFAPNGAYGLDFTFDDPVTSHNKSGFLHTLYHATDNLTFEAGVRYSKEDKTYTYTRNELPLTPADPLFPGGIPIPGFENHPSLTASDSRPDYKGGVQYQFTPELMTYAQVSTGFKGGGVNPRPVFASDILPFGTEKLISYEVGEKIELFDRRIRLNSAVFYSTYTNLQLTVFNDHGSNQVENAGKVHIYGLESEVVARPVASLQVDASVGYLMYDIASLGAAAGIAGVTTESQPANVPRWKGSVGIQFDFRLPSTSVLTPRLDWSYQSGVFNDPQNTPAGFQAGYGVLNARVGWASSGKWSAAVEAANVTDKHYYINETVNLSSYGYLVGQPALPRTVLLSVKRTF